MEKIKTEVEYIGDENWECPKRGREISVGKPDDDDDGGESLSVCDAVLIGVFNGKEEDYTLDYSEDEMERVLRGVIPIND